MKEPEPDPIAPDTHSTDSTSEHGPSLPSLAAGWVMPPRRGGRGGRRRLLTGCLIGAVLVGAASIVLPLFAMAILDGSTSTGPDVISLGFGTGGSGCTLSDVASSFPVGVPVRSVLTLPPDLPAGETVGTRMLKDGAEIAGAHQTITPREGDTCIYVTLPELEVGHYRMEFDVHSDQMPPTGGEFDVTP